MSKADITNNRVPRLKRKANTPPKSEAKIKTVIKALLLKSNDLNSEKYGSIKFIIKK